MTRNNRKDWASRLQTVSKSYLDQKLVFPSVFEPLFCLKPCRSLSRRGPGPNRWTKSDGGRKCIKDCESVRLSVRKLAEVDGRWWKLTECRRMVSTEVGGVLAEIDGSWRNVDASVRSFATLILGSSRSQWNQTTV